MPISRKHLTTVREFVAPESIDNAPEDERGRYFVRALTTGIRRYLAEILAGGASLTYAEIQRLQAYLTYGGSTLAWEDGEPIFPPPIEQREILSPKGKEHRERWMDAWDSLPIAVSEWIMDCVYEMNPDWDPDSANPI